MSEGADICYALVTGASSGIGKAYAEYLGQRNDYALLLIARRGDLLQPLKRDIDQFRRAHFKDDARAVETVATDLLDQSALAALIDYVQTDERPVDMLVNCAGFATLGAFYGTDIEKELSVVELNCLVPMRLVRAVVPGMVARNGGTIINVSSIGAFQPAPYMAVYAASKSFVLNYTLAIAEELKPTAFRVFAHCPGRVSSRGGVARGYDSVAPDEARDGGAGGDAGPAKEQRIFSQWICQSLDGAFWQTILACYLGEDGQKGATVALEAMTHHMGMC